MNIPLWRKRDPLTADRLNAPVQAVNGNLPVIGGTGIKVSQGTNGTVVSLQQPGVFRPPGCYMIRNDDTVDLKAHQIMGITGSLHNQTTELEAFQNDITFVGTRPHNSHFGRWCSTLEAIPKDEYGLVHVGLVAVAKVNIVHTNHLCAGLTDNEQDYLTSAPIAVAQLLLVAAATGMMWQYIRMGTTFASEDCPGT